MDDREKKLEKEMEQNTVILLRGLFRLVCFVTALVAVISVIWAKWFVFRVCLTILALALAVLVIREWSEIKEDK